MRAFFKKVTYSLSANLITFINSFIVIFIVPKFISIEAYGYFQYYLFFVSYLGILHFGWIEGIYLRLGGVRWEKLDKTSIASQFWYFSLLEILIALLVFSGSRYWITDPNKLIVFNLLSFSIIFVLPQTFLSFLIQATNRIKTYSIAVVFWRGTNILLVLLALGLGHHDFQHLITACVLAQFAACVYIIVKASDMVFTFPLNLPLCLSEAGKNLYSGSQLLIANIAGLLIVGVVRWNIEREWNIETFGKVSLAISFLAMMMMAVRTISTVLFPTLRQLSQEVLITYYTSMRSLLTPLLLAALLIYFPLIFIMKSWLPDFTTTLPYMALLFPLSIYEGKMAILVDTYLKTLRKERWLLYINLATLCFSFFFVYIFIYQLKNLNLAILSITLLLAGRAIWAGTILSRSIPIKLLSENIEILGLSTLFILSSLYLEPEHTFIFYSISLSLYLLKNLPSIKSALKTHALFSSGTSELE